MILILGNLTLAEVDLAKRFGNVFNMSIQWEDEGELGVETVQVVSLLKMDSLLELSSMVGRLILGGKLGDYYEINVYRPEEDTDYHPDQRFSFINAFSDLVSDRRVRYPHHGDGGECEQGLPKPEEDGTALGGDDGSERVDEEGECGRMGHRGGEDGEE